MENCELAEHIPPRNKMRVERCASMKSAYMSRMLCSWCGEDSSRCLLGCDAVKWCRKPTFRSNSLPPSSGLWHHLVMW